MEIIYQAKAVSTGGRDGQVAVENSSLHFEMALPTELGGSKKEGINPEQLFAAGYSACFGSAVQHVLKQRKLTMEPPTVEITAGIGQDPQGGFALEAEITVLFKGIDSQLAQQLAEEAHGVCPYSKATRGNIEIKVTGKSV